VGGPERIEVISFEDRSTAARSPPWRSPDRRSTAPASGRSVEWARVVPFPEGAERAGWRALEAISEHTAP